MLKIFFHLVALYHDKNTSKHVITYIGRNIIKHGIISLDITLQNLEFTAKKKLTSMWLSKLQLLLLGTPCDETSQLCSWNYCKFCQARHTVGELKIYYNT